MLNCFHPWTFPMLLAVMILGLGCLIFLIMRSRRLREDRGGQRAFPLSAWIVLASVASASAFIIWAGSYTFSPLGLLQQPSLKAFAVQMRGGRSLLILPGDGFSMSIGSVAYIAVISVPPAKSCFWMSSSGGTLDTNRTCDIVYTPPATELDILRVAVKPSCGLPITGGQIKIAIYP